MQIFGKTLAVRRKDFRAGGSLSRGGCLELWWLCVGVFCVASEFEAAAALYQETWAVDPLFRHPSAFGVSWSISFGDMVFAYSFLERRG